MFVQNSDSEGATLIASVYVATLNDCIGVELQSFDRLHSSTDRAANRNSTDQQEQPQDEPNNEDDIDLPVAANTEGNFVMQMKITMIILLYTCFLYVKVLRMKQLMAIYKIKLQRIIQLKLIMVMKLISYRQQMLTSEWHPSCYDCSSLE